MIYGHVYDAWRVFRKGKRPSRHIDEFAYYLERNITDLTTQINEKTYRHGGYQRIVVSDKKRRDLAVATVRDRVIHRYIYDRLVVCFDKSFDPDVWSCRQGKGLHRALDRTRQLLARHADSYVWRADITKFFDHVHHDILRAELARRLGEDSELLWLSGKVIESYTSVDMQRGIPIGNLTSQIFSNIYLNMFDRFVRHQLKPQGFVRYGDDFILIAPTRRRARHYQLVASKFLYDTLDLTVNPRSNVVVPAASGLHFLGHAVFSRYAVVDKHTSQAVLAKVRCGNLASYQSLALAKHIKKELYWRILDENAEILDKMG
ncbi:MAG TPA: reverse transcriptase/maturase family protein [Candidatus Saccharibacteria bacterium]|nr:reverse transcriptase/maturase family protein [Candidatus Saccharibacteria bacterium]HMR38260.1 reverse transcriptase/maturase family protein [Candidatus Saccharibacteria bacterium]